MLQNSFSTFDLDQPNLEGSFLPDQEFFHWPVPSQSSFSPLFTNARRLSKPIFSVGAREDRWAYHHEQRAETRRDTRREERRGKEEERESNDESFPQLRNRVPRVPRPSNSSLMKDNHV